MSDLPAAPRSMPKRPPAPRINALQGAWLRELGVPRSLVPAALRVHVPDATDAGLASAKVQKNQSPAAAAPAVAAAGVAARTENTRAAIADGAPTQAATEHTDAPVAAGVAVSAGAARNAMPSGKASSATSGKPSPVADAMRLLAAGRKGRGAARPTPPVVTPPPRANPASGAQADSAVAGQEGSAQPAQEVKAYAPRVPGDIEQADLDTLTAMVETCGACGLCASRQHAVFGSGSANAQWMVVGEAPGEQEDMQALPFVGKSGQLLTEMLRAVGVDREQGVFISNVIKCRPPGNRNPQPEEIAECKPFLMRQISLVAPKRLLVLGRFAAQVLLGSDANLGALRGQVHTFVDSQGRSIPMVVSYHPAYLLRSPQEKARAWRDLRMAARVL